MDGLLSEVLFCVLERERGRITWEEDEAVRSHAVGG
jgi:hypothetical protein